MRATHQVGVVTGASSGIGKAIALALGRLGMQMVLIGRDSMRLQATAAEMQPFSSRTEIYRADLTNDEDIDHVALSVKKDFGTVDVLVHSVGIFRGGLLSEVPVAELDALYQTNVRAPYAITQALLPMICARNGQIVFINSSVGLLARAEVSAYAATKHALKAIADSLRAEVNAAGVRVLTVYPGRTATPQQEKIHQQEGKPYCPQRLVQPEDIAALVVNALKLPRTAEVTDFHVRPMMKA